MPFILGGEPKELGLVDFGVCIFRDYGVGNCMVFNGLTARRIGGKLRFIATGLVKRFSRLNVAIRITLVSFLSIC